MLTGIRFLTDYFHTAIILIIACYLSIKAFTFEEVGSIGKLYELVQAAAQRHPVSGNQDGTYLTMTSKGVRTIVHVVVSANKPRLSCSEFFIFAPTSA